jgi:hypothetical protein
MTTLSRIRAKIIEAIPEIETHIGVIEGQPTKVQGRPIRLDDVLRAMSESKTLYAIDADGNFHEKTDRGWPLCEVGVRVVAWNLALSVDDQEPEVHEFIGKVLGV